MKKLLFAILSFLGLACTPVQSDAAAITLGNKSISFLAGLPFYAAFGYSSYKVATDNNVFGTLHAPGSIASLMTGGLISALTYIGLTKRVDKDNEQSNKKLDAFLTGAPLYAGSAYLMYKTITYKDLVGFDLKPVLYVYGSLMSLLTGALTSAFTYIVITKRVDKEIKQNQ